METNSLIKQIEQLRDLVSNSRQVQWYEDLLKVAKPVTVSPISEVLSEEQIQYIKDNIQLRKRSVIDTLLYSACTSPTLFM